MKNSKGLTVMELLVSVALLALVIVVTVPGLRSFFLRMEIHAALRTVTVALSTARTTAIRDNLPVRAEVVDNCLQLSRDDGHGWRVIHRFELGGKVAVRANGRPVFSPLGFVSPLCTITVEKERRVRRVVLSMYGRLKVYDNG